MNGAGFYITNNYTCPQCGFMLCWAKHPNVTDSMMLVHGDYWREDPSNRCPNAGKSFYAPVANLTEIPPDMIEIG